jgi:thiol-disulfide isomerase/thioredoxin
VNKQQFEDALSNQKNLAVIKFSASWCKPCQEIAQSYKELAETLTHVKFYHLDYD